MDRRPFNILVAEDNLGHQRLTEYALRRNPVPVRPIVVRDGQEVLDYLHHRPPYGDVEKFPRPDLILLDLNLPKRDGREVLSLIKENPALCDIPVIIVSTSDREEDVRHALQTGAVAYISKSKGFDRYSDEIAGVAAYIR